MELTTRSVHVKTGKKLANSIEHKFSRLEKLYDRIIYCDVTISKEKNTQQKNCVVVHLRQMDQISLLMRLAIRLLERRQFNVHQDSIWIQSR